ncbi:MAG: HEAT repeat domain-containing protein [Candidatus Thorarchaeota archaeon]
MTRLLEDIADAVERGDMRVAAQCITGSEDEFLAEVGRLFDKGEKGGQRLKERILSVVDRLDDRLAVDVIRLAIWDDDRLIRVRGLQAAYRRRLDALNMELAELLSDRSSDFEIRKWILHILTSTEPKYFGRMIRKLARDHSETIELRREAIFALTNVADDESIGTLCAMMGDPIVEVRQAAAWALSRISSPQSIPCLLAALEDAHSDVRDWAIRGLRDMDDTRALQGLAEAIRRAEPEEQVRLIRLVAEKRSEIIQRAVTEALESPSVDVRREAAWALSVMPYPPAATSLQALLDDDDVQVRNHARRALMRLVSMDSSGIL